MLLRIMIVKKENWRLSTNGCIQSFASSIFWIVFCNVPSMFHGRLEVIHMQKWLSLSYNAQSWVCTLENCSLTFNQAQSWPEAISFRESNVHDITHLLPPEKSIQITVAK